VPTIVTPIRLVCQVNSRSGPQGVGGTKALLDSLTTPWLDAGVAAAGQVAIIGDRTAMRLGVAVTRGLLLDLVAGADERDVTSAYELFVELFEGSANARRTPP